MLMDETSMFTCQPPPAYLTVEHLLPGEPRHPVRVTESEGQPSSCSSSDLVRVVVAVLMIAPLLFLPATVVAATVVAATVVATVPGVAQMRHCSVSTTMARRQREGSNSFIVLGRRLGGQEQGYQTV